MTRLTGEKSGFCVKLAVQCEGISLPHAACAITYTCALLCKIRHAYTVRTLQGSNPSGKICHINTVRVLQGGMSIYAQPSLTYAIYTQCVSYRERGLYTQTPPCEIRHMARVCVLHGEVCVCKPWETLTHCSLLVVEHDLHSTSKSQAVSQHISQISVCTARHAPYRHAGSVWGDDGGKLREGRVQNSCAYGHVYTS